MIETSQAYVPPAFERGERAWGWGVNLYALRSKRNWGIGDFTDLAALVGLARAFGADLVGVNPLHALHWTAPEGASPYSPTSRFFLNPLYIDVATIPDFDLNGAGGAFLMQDHVLDDLVRARENARVDYTLVASLKRRGLEIAYESYRSNASAARAEAFRDFALKGGERLERFAWYEALNEHFSLDEPGAFGWLNWPQEFQSPGSPAVKRLAQERGGRVGFFIYLQFVAHEQLAAVALDARALGIGLYCDLAVGVDPNSADVWSDRERYVLGESIGAPPDPLGPLGQNWGLAPLDVTKIERDGGAFFRELLRANMEHAGALRIDHVMALRRQFRIPRGSLAAGGTYVDYPFDLLLEIAAEESRRARCLVVGEDLGTVPDGFRERMASERILSYRLLLFERDEHGEFIAPAAYPVDALATATTHDLPTMAGWPLGRDIDVRARLGHLDAHGARAAHAERRVEATRLLRALAREGLMDHDTVERMHRTIDAGATEPAAYEPLVSAAYGFLARTPARVVLVQFDDAAGELDQVNMPGTSLEYPNWRRKNRIALEDLGRHEQFARLAGTVRASVRKEPVP
ncbi:MAG: 4-alpha-glucanotransferase [Candidatus Eremiobacteraeota bacterium]|nr:4-alpha-glucanotransferase [Candidatus Eremiobacteraeota bacterium]